MRVDSNAAFEDYRVTTAPGSDFVDPQRVRPLPKKRPAVFLNLSVVCCLLFSAYQFLSKI